MRFLVLFVIFVSQLTKLLAQDFDYKPPFNYRVDTGLYTGYEFTELGYYSYYGDLDKVKELVEAGADIEEGMSDGYTVSGVLHTAAISLNLELFEYILSLDCDLSMIASERGIMPVTTTASLEDEEISYQTTKMLLERGVKPNGAGYLGYEAVNTVYPLLEAAYQGNVRSMELLLDYGADLIFRNVWDDILPKIIKSHDRTDLEPEQRQRQGKQLFRIIKLLIDAGYKDESVYVKEAISLAHQRGNLSLEALLLYSFDKITSDFLLTDDYNPKLPYVEREWSTSYNELGYWVKKVTLSRLSV